MSLYYRHRRYKYSRIFTDGDTTIYNGGYINRQCHFTTDIDVINTAEYSQTEIQRYIMVVISIDNVTLLQTSTL